MVPEHVSRMPDSIRSVRPSKQLLRVKVLVSYAHRDERLREELDKHLSSLRRSPVIDSWHDRRIIPGAVLGKEIAHLLASSDLVLLLVSPDFINSDYCYRREMKDALRRHAKGQVRVVPIILRPVDWLSTSIGKLLALPTDGKPVTTWHRRDEAFLDITNGVRRVAEEIEHFRSKGHTDSQDHDKRKMTPNNTHEHRPERRNETPYAKVYKSNA
jgi:TIR domain